jgi:hypothetical protein
VFVHVTWHDLFDWQTITAFWMLDLMLALAVLLLAAPIVTICALNIFGLPSIFDVFHRDGLTSPFLQGVARVSNFVVRYWYLIALAVLGPTVGPTYSLLSGRIAWLACRHADPCSQ